MAICPPNTEMGYNIVETKYLTGNVIFYNSEPMKFAKAKKQTNKTHDWITDQNAEWIAKNVSPIDQHNLEINSEIILKIPYANKFLIEVFENAKYILELKEDWDDEGALPYSNEVWKAGAIFLLQFYDWLNVNSKGTLHIPKMHHGPNESIDIAWNEDNLRFFINIDKNKNIGTFYSDTPNSQYSEGKFSLNNIRFHMLPIPYKY